MQRLSSTLVLCLHVASAASMRSQASQLVAKASMSNQSRKALMIPFEGSVRKFRKMSHLSATKSLDHKTSIFDDAMENPHCSEITIIPDVA